MIHIQSDSTDLSDNASLFHH